MTLIVTLFAVAAGLVGSSLAKSAGKPEIDGYVLYLKTDLRVGDLELKKDDAIVVRPKLLQVKDDGKKASMEAEFRVLKNGTPLDPVLRGWFEFDQLTRRAPLSPSNDARREWTVEPSKTPPVPLPRPRPPEAPPRTPIQGVARLASAEARVTDPVALIAEFHDSAGCADVNATADAAGVSRRTQFLKAWDDFIAEKAGRRCARSAKDETCAPLNKARAIDILTRTAVFEVEPPSRRYPPEQTKVRSRCELDLVMLTLRMRAFDKMCDVKPGKRPPKFGCEFPGDYVGVCTKPSELNIWSDKDTMTTRITGCFLRADADKIEWADRGGRKAFMRRRDEYRAGLERALRVTGERPVEEMFDVSSTVRSIGPEEKRRLIEGTKFYYHPIGMAKCNPATYDRTVFIAFGYAKKGDDAYLLSSVRLVPRAHDGGAAIDDVYEEESPLPKAMHASFEEQVKDAVIPERFVDRMNHNRCWPPPSGSACQTTPWLGARKMPKWAIAPGNETYRVSCRADETPEKANELPPLTWTWAGLCDPGMVIVPEYRNTYKLDPLNAD